MLLSSLAAATVLKKYTLADKTPEEVGQYQYRHAARPPTDKYPDPSKFGRPSMVRGDDLPVPARPDLDTMQKDYYLLSDPAYNAAYQKGIYDHQTDQLVGDFLYLKSSWFAGPSCYRFAPHLRKNKILNDPRKDPDFQVQS